MRHPGYLLSLTATLLFLSPAYADLGDPSKVVHVSVTLNTGEKLEGMSWGIAGGYTPKENPFKFILKDKEGTISVKLLDSSLPKQTMVFDWKTLQAVRLGSHCKGGSPDFTTSGPTESDSVFSCSPSFEIWQANPKDCLPPTTRKLSLSSVKSITYFFKIDSMKSQKLRNQFSLRDLENRCHNSSSFVTSCGGDADSVVHTFFDPARGNEDPKKVRNLFELSAVMKTTLAGCGGSGEISAALKKPLPADFLSIKELKMLSEKAEKVNLLETELASLKAPASKPNAGPTAFASTCYNNLITSIRKNETRYENVRRHSVETLRYSELSPKELECLQPEYRQKVKALEQIIKKDSTELSSLLQTNINEGQQKNEQLKSLQGKRIELLKQELSIYKALIQEPRNMPSEATRSQYLGIIQTLEKDIHTAELDLKRTDPRQYSPSTDIMHRTFSGPNWQADSNKVATIDEELKRVSQKRQEILQSENSTNSAAEERSTSLRHSFHEQIRLVKEAFMNRPLEISSEKLSTVTRLEQEFTKVSEAFHTEVMRVGPKLVPLIDAKAKKWVVLDQYMPVFQEENWQYPSAPSGK